MKHSIAKAILMIGYCVPFVFLAMNEDVTVGTLWSYLIMAIGFGILCYGSVKTKSPWIVVVGNILSFASSCIFTYLFRTDKWGWYFKPFTPCQTIVFETVFAFLIQMIVVICILKKRRTAKKIDIETDGSFISKNGMKRGDDMNFIVKTFSELSVDELYEILKSRAEIFLLEQHIACQDLDDIDKTSIHCFFTDENRVVAYLRAFPSGNDSVTVGRVLTLEHRKGLGSKLMEKSLVEIKNRFGCSKICVHAQKQAVKFYEKMGFSIVSDEYLEEGVIHLTMEKPI